MRISTNQERQMQRVIIKAFSRVSGQARIDLHADKPLPRELRLHNHTRQEVDSKVIQHHH